MKYSFKNNVIEIILPEKVGYSAIESFSSIIRDPKLNDITVIMIDFKDSSFITLPGAMYIILFCTIVTSRNRFSVTQVRNLKSDVKAYLMSLRFFSTLVGRGELIIDKYTLQQEDSLSKRDTATNNSLILPITYINYGEDKSHYDSFTKNFRNQFIQFFAKITRFKQFNYLNNIDESQELHEALNESIKNIFDHSFSEGLAAVHASMSLKGTTMVFCDLGIGIAKGVIDTRIQNITTERDAIYWALKDGNSRKKLVRENDQLGNLTNQGHGFTVLTNFINQKKGILTLRTGKYEFIYRNQHWKDKQVKSFPGTQLIIYTPTL